MCGVPVPFISTVRQISGNLGHIRPRVPFDHHNHLKLYSSVHGRRLSPTLTVVGYMAVDK